MEKLKISEASPDLSFPLRLYLMLRDAEEEFPEAIRWVPSSNGKIFEMSNPDLLEKQVLPTYFNTSIKFTSFRRQLIGYGFICCGKRQCKLTKTCYDLISAYLYVIISLIRLKN
jgi:hypothetical protein